MDKSDVIAGLEHCSGSCVGCPYDGDVRCQASLFADALALLRGSFRPDEACKIISQHGQNDRRFRFGEMIRYMPSDVQEILEEAAGDAVR